MSGDSVVYATIGELAARLARRDLGTLELFDAFAARIERYAETSKAFISLDLDRARDRAAAQDGMSGVRGRLRGIPWSCKDLFDVRGIATTAGSSVLRDNIATRDADAVARLDRAGAIYLGKNNLHEFAYGATGENALYGTSPNPYDRERLAGGSSSGSAAALGFGLCAAALGTDTGGSVRAPAALSGLAGFKPTYGRLSVDGVIPFSWSLDHVGSLTRCAADAGLLFEVLAGDYRAPAAVRLAGQRIGIPGDFFFDHCDVQILAAIEHLMRFLESAGAVLETVALPAMTHTRAIALTVQMPEALSYHNRYLEQRGHLYGADFRAGLALGQSLLAEHYVRARRFIELYRREMAQVFDRVDLLLTPATPCIAPAIGSVEVQIDGGAEPAGNAITRYTSFFNLTGHPAITLPCAIHAEGLPIAAQFIGRHHQDERLLALVSRIEADYGFELPLPALP